MADEIGPDDTVMQPSASGEADATTAMNENLLALVGAVALALEAQLGLEDAIRTAGGPYVESQLIAIRKRLHEAAVAAIQTIVAFVPLAPTQQ